MMYVAEAAAQKMAKAASEWITAAVETNEREKISGPSTNPFFNHCAGRRTRSAAGVRGREVSRLRGLAVSDCDI